MNDLLAKKKEEDLVDTLSPKDLPSSWTLATIPELVAKDGVFIDGDWIESKDQDPNGDVRLIQLADIGDGFYRNRSDRYLTYNKALKLGCTFLRIGDVLVARMPDPLGRACIFPGDTKKSVTVVDVCIIRPNRTDVDNHWLMYFINATAFRNTVASLQSGSTRKRISRSNLAKIQLPVPPSKEQKLIVAEIEKQFSRLDEAVANLKRVKANLKRYKAAVLKAAVEGKLTQEWRKAHPDVEGASELLKLILTRRAKASKQKEVARLNEDELSRLPRTWRWAKTADVGDIQLGRQRAPRYHKGRNMRPYLRVQNVFEDRIDTSDVMEMVFAPDDFSKYRLEPGDILLNEGQSPELLGRPAIYRGEIPNACFTNTLIRFKVSWPMQPEFPLIVFRSYMRSGRFRGEGTITTNIAHLSAGRFANIEFPLPPLAEQEAIVKDVARRLSIIDMLDKEVENNLLRSEHLRQSILKRAFTGELTDYNRGLKKVIHSGAFVKERIL